MRETTRLKALLCFVVFLPSCAMAADPRVEPALRAFSVVAADPDRLKIYCTMSASIDALDEKEDAEQEASISRYLQQLGPEFEKAWALADEFEVGSADARMLEKAVDDLTSLCD